MAAILMQFAVGAEVLGGLPFAGPRRGVLERVGGVASADLRVAAEQGRTVEALAQALRRALVEAVVLAVVLEVLQRAPA